MHLVVGGTGALGRHAVGRLRRAGEPVRVLTRDPARAADLARAGAEVVRGDLRDRASLEAACRGATTVLAAAHSMLGRGDAASARVDGAGNRDLVDAARRARVRRFVYVSVHVPPRFDEVPFFRIKREMEAYLRASGLPFTVLRPTAFMETHAHQLIGDAVLRGRRVVLFGHGERPRNFVAADDVARLAVRALADPALRDRTIEVGGPEDLTAMDVVRVYERLAGRRARVTRLPLPVLRVASRLARPLHAGIAQVLQAGVLGDGVDQRFDAAPLAEWFPDGLTRLEDWAARRVSA